MTTENRTIFAALDVEDIQSHPRGQRVINGLMSCKGNRLYRTARGRLAIQTQPENLPKLMAQLKFTIQEGLDGARLVTIPLEAAVVTATVTADLSTAIELVAAAA